MINNNDLNIIYLDFYSWLTGLVEDDPIPFEIKSIIFYINKNFEIGFSGSENDSIKIVDYGTYFPLESQYFYSQKLVQIVDKNFEDKFDLMFEVLENLLKKYLKENKNIFFNKNIFYGKLFDKAKLLKFNK